jgi:hypothetical protein
VVYALNRGAYEIHNVAIIMYMTYLKDKIIAASNSNQHYLKIKETLHQGNFQ